MKNLLEILTNATIKPYLDNAKRLSGLNIAWRSYINLHWVNHCSIANYEDGILTLGVTSSSWATRIRYALPEITKELIQHHEFHGLKKIRCKVIPPAVETIPVHASKQMTPYAHQLLVQMAQAITHPKLKSSLLKLAGE